MSRQRAYFTATLLLSGKLLIVGGVNDVSQSGYATNAVETYDPATQYYNGSTFGAGSAYGSAAPMSLGRAGHTATLLANGKVLVVGGYTKLGTMSLSSAEVYDPAHDSWSMTAPLHYPRSLQAAVLMAGGKVMVTGGSEYAPTITTSPRGSAPATIPPEIYDPTSNLWSVATMPKLDRPVDPTATLLEDGRILVVGGENMLQSPDQATERSEVYDPSSNTWSDVTPDPHFAARQFQVAALMSDGRVLIAGGSIDLQATNTAAIYDPASNAWIDLPNMFVANCGGTAARLASGLILVLGSGCQSPQGGSTQEFDPSTDSWHWQGSGGTGAGSVAVVLPNGYALEIGGVQAPLPTSSSFVWLIVFGPFSAP